MFVFVRLRFLSDLPITLIASLLVFHVSVVRFNVWLKLSINDNVLLNSMYKSCPLFVITTKIELSIPLQSLNINLSNAAICILSCSSAFVKKDLPSSQGFFPREDKGDREGPLYHLLFLSLENRRWGRGRGEGASQSFGKFNHPCSAV